MSTDIPGLNDGDLVAAFAQAKAALTPEEREAAGDALVAGILKVLSGWDRAKAGGP